MNKREHAKDTFNKIHDFYLTAMQNDDDKIFERADITLSTTTETQSVLIDIPNVGWVNLVIAKRIK